MAKKKGWEGSAKDEAEDKHMAKKRGMSMKQWENSAADKRHDVGKRIAKMEKKNGRV